MKFNTTFIVFMILIGVIALIAIVRYEVNEPKIQLVEGFLTDDKNRNEAFKIEEKCKFSLDIRECKIKYTLEKISASKNKENQ